MAHTKDSTHHGHHGHKRTSSNHHNHTTATTTSGHARKKSNNSNHLPTGDVVRLKRPGGGLSRRVTPVSVLKLGRNLKTREKEWAETTTEEIEDEVEEERESFPLYCMACEKEFVPYDNTNLYCSDACRADDESPSHPSLSASTPTIPYFDSSYPYPYTYTISRPRLPSSESDVSEPRDIVPRAAPSRPNSMALSVSPPTLSPIMTTDAATYPHHSQSSAMSALRSVTHPSPPSPTSGFSSWRPWKSSVPETPTSATSKRSSGWFSTTLDSPGGYGQYGYHYDAHGMERPLAPRKPGASVRPKSIELVTPLIMGRWDS